MVTAEVKCPLPSAHLLKPAHHHTDKTALTWVGKANIKFSYPGLGRLKDAAENG